MKRPTAHEVCAKRWMHFLLFGSDHVKILTEFDLSDIESDKRKHGKLVRTLLDEGCLERNAVKWILTSKAFDTLSSSKPDLVRRVVRESTHREMLRARPGVDWYSENPHQMLTLEEKKWILEHRSDYQIVWWNHFDLTEVNALDRDWQTRGGNSAWHLTVRDNAFKLAQEEATFDVQLKELLPKNVAWGFVSGGFAAESDADAFKYSDGSGFTTERVFSPDVGKWREQCIKGAEFLEARIERDRRHAAALRVVNQRIEQAGGWEKFVVDYTARLAAELRKKEAE